VVIQAEPVTQERIDAIVADLRVALGELRCVGSERMVKQGVSMTHLHILSMLDHHGELTMSRLAELLDVSLSNATGLVDRAEERGSVERLRDHADRRVVTVRLTEVGRSQLRELQVLKEELLQKILGRMSDVELQTVSEALQCLRKAALGAAGDPDVAAYWHAHTHSDVHAAAGRQGGTITA